MMNNFVKDLIAKYQFWKAKKLKLDVDYKLQYDE